MRRGGVWEIQIDPGLWDRDNLRRKGQCRQKESPGRREHKFFELKFCFTLKHTFQLRCTHAHTQTSRISTWTQLVLDIPAFFNWSQVRHQQSHLEIFIQMAGKPMTWVTNISRSLFARNTGQMWFTSASLQIHTLTLARSSAMANTSASQCRAGQCAVHPTHTGVHQSWGTRCWLTPAMHVIIGIRIKRRQRHPYRL